MSGSGSQIRGRKKAPQPAAATGRLLGLPTPAVIMNHHPSDHQKKLIQKVPSCLREVEHTSDAYDTKAVSFGPYHHGKPDLRFCQDAKRRTLKMFVEGTSDGRDEHFFMSRDHSSAAPPPSVAAVRTAAVRLLSAAPAPCGAAPAPFRRQRSQIDPLYDRKMCKAPTYEFEIEDEEENYLIVREKLSRNNIDGIQEVLIHKHDAVCRLCYKILEEIDSILKTICECQFTLLHTTCAAQWSATECANCHKIIQTMPVTISNSRPKEDHEPIPNFRLKEHHEPIPTRNKKGGCCSIL